VKYTYILIVFIIALVLVLVSVLFKIMHLELGLITGNVLLFIGISFKILASILLIKVLLKRTKSKD
jgi:hypothetical protein